MRSAELRSADASRRFGRCAPDLIGAGLLQYPAHDLRPDLHQQGDQGPEQQAVDQDGGPIPVRGAHQ